MLKLMRENTGSWIIKILLGLIVLVFVFLGMGSVGSNRGNQVALVNDSPISLDEYRRSYQNIIEQMRQRFGNNLNDELLEMLQVKKQALDRLIEERLVMGEAEKNKFTVSDEEVRNTLLTIDAFKKNGVFDLTTYKTVLSRNRLNPEIFENMQKESLLLSKVRDLVLSNITVSDLEASEWQKYNKTEVSLNYVAFEPKNFKEIDLGEEKIKAFYEKNKNAYKSEPMVKVSYLEFNGRDYKDKASISVDRLKAYYEENISQYEIAPKVEARHILLKTVEGATPAELEKVKARAEVISKKARAGADFAELAKEFSEGPSQSSGGYLGSFTRDSMVKPFSDKAFSMEPGDISQPVKTQFGYHIIKVESKYPESKISFENAKPGIQEIMEKEEIKTIAYSEAGKAFDAIIDGDDLVQAGLIAGREVKTVGPFTRKGPENAVEDAAAFAQASFTLPAMEISDVKEIAGSYFIIQLLEKIEPSVLEFEKVKTRVENDYRIDQQSKMAEKNANEFLAAVKKDGDLKKIASEKGKTVSSTKFFTRSGKVAELGNSPDVSAAAFKLNSKAPLHGKVIKGKGNFYIITLNGEKIPVQADIDKNIKTIKKELLGLKQGRRYTAWIEELKSKSEIVIEKGFLD